MLLNKYSLQEHQKKQQLQSTYQNSRQTLGFQKKNIDSKIVSGS